MNDREKIEFAASLIGMAGAWSDEANALVGPTTSGDLYHWNPRTDSGDALHLALRLGIQVWRRGDRLQVGHQAVLVSELSDMYDTAREMILDAAVPSGVRDE